MTALSALAILYEAWCPSEIPAAEITRLHHCPSLSLLKTYVSFLSLGILEKCLKMCHEIKLSIQKAI